MAFRGEQLGKYEILTRLTVGGMAELFLAFTSGPGGFRKYVVLKRILPEVRRDEQFVKMFLDEARISAGLNHPNIAHVFDLGEEDAGLFLAMEFIAGRNLNQITAAQLNRRALLPAGFCGTVARDVCLALHYAHTFTDPSGKARPIIHRDVAQKNVMVTYDGVTKLLDFGIAKARGSLGKTTAGMVKGTTGYMSPEQVQAQSLDGRSDVFSVGVMLYELVTGRRLFSGATEEEEMKKILADPIPSPRLHAPHCSVALDKVILKALCRDRNGRYTTAREMSKALEEALGAELFSQERCGEFMRALFTKKMAATQALFESAEKEGREGIEGSVVRVFRDDDSGDANARSLSKDDPFSMAPTSQRRLGQGLVVALGLFAVGGIGVFVWKSRREEPVVARPSRTVPIPQTITLDDRPEGLPSPAPPPLRSVTINPQKAPEPFHGHLGMLTLITQPECEVRYNLRKLGRTPLLETSLPVGKHALDLIGDDGSHHRLRVNIRNGKKTTLHVELDRLR